MKKLSFVLLIGLVGSLCYGADSTESSEIEGSGVSLASPRSLAYLLDEPTPFPATSLSSAFKYQGNCWNDQTLELGSSLMRSRAQIITIFDEEKNKFLLTHFPSDLPKAANRSREDLIRLYDINLQLRITAFDQGLSEIMGDLHILKTRNIDPIPLLRDYLMPAPDRLILHPFCYLVFKEEMHSHMPWAKVNHFFSPLHYSWQLVDSFLLRNGNHHLIESTQHKYFQDKVFLDTAMQFKCPGLSMRLVESSDTLLDSSEDEK